MGIIHLEWDNSPLVYNKVTRQVDTLKFKAKIF